MRIVMNLVSTAEAAEILGVDVSTVNRWAADGRLPEAMRAPGARRPRIFSRTQVEALKAERAARRCVDVQAA